MITLMQLWDLATVPLFDMDAPGYNTFAKFNGDFNKMPGYIPSKIAIEYADAEVEEISWHSNGIAVKFYKGDENEE